MGDLEDNIALLSDRSSGKRRSAAKRLGKLADPAAGPALYQALQREVLDPRTWETQLMLILALGHCAYAEALPFLKSRVGQNPSTAIDSALGNAIVRLSSTGKQDAAPVMEIMAGDADLMMLSGAFKAMALLRLVPPAEQIDKILAFLDEYGETSPLTLHLWPAAAAAGWSHHPKVEAFLNGCLQSPREDVRGAASLSLQRKYKNWDPF